MIIVRCVCVCVCSMMYRAIIEFISVLVRDGHIREPIQLKFQRAIFHNLICAGELKVKNFMKKKESPIDMSIAYS